MAEFKKLVRKALGAIDPDTRLRKLETSLKSVQAKVRDLERTQRKQHSKKNGRRPDIKGSERGSVIPLETQTGIAANVWEKYEDEDYRRDQSHWRSEGRWKDVEKWEATGRSTLKELKRAAAFVGRPEFLDGTGSLLEWGPGGGTNLLALRGSVRKLVGVDISQKNLEEARRVLAEVDFHDFQPVLLTKDPSSIAEQLPDDIKIFVSTAVFQHFPSQKYGAEVLNVVASALVPGAVGLIQIRYDDGNPRYAPKELEDYKKQHIRATSYSLVDFWTLLQECGLEPLYVRKIKPSHNYAVFLFEKPVQ